MRPSERESKPIVKTEKWSEAWWAFFEYALENEGHIFDAFCNEWELTPWEIWTMAQTHKQLDCE